MTRIAPQEGPQEVFLSSPADIAIYGGGAGGGKTWALLLEAIRHVLNPTFGGVLFRRTYPQITAIGGMWDESLKLYPLLGAKPNKTDLYWEFPSGMKLKFAHMQYERHMFEWQGSQLPFIGYDELTHFSESQFFYMLSRNRTLSGVKPYIRGTCNPDPDSWVAKLIEWWINQETGYPIPERSGVIRWFVRDQEDMLWGDSKEELIAKGFAPLRIKSLTFIPASVHDNKVLMETNPEYLGNLQALPLIDRERLLGGNWKIKPAAGKLFNRAWFEIVDAVPSGGEECRFWDFAATEKKISGRDPDYTASVRIRKVRGTYYVLDMTAEQIGAVEADKQMANITIQDAKEAEEAGANYKVAWEIEPASAGKKENARLIRLLDGFEATGEYARGDKVQRLKPLAAQSEAGNVKLLRGEWNQMWLNHMHGQPELDHDDIADASGGAYRALCKGEIQIAPGLWG